MKPALLIAALLFVLAALVQLVCVVLGVRVFVGAAEMPLWAWAAGSAAAMGIAGLLVRGMCAAGPRERTRGGQGRRAPR